MISDVQDLTSFKWATIKGVGPLSIQLDGDTSPLALIPDSLVDPLSLAVNDRVRVELSLRKVVIHGRNNGASDAVGVAVAVPASAGYTSTGKVQRVGSSLILTTGNFAPAATGANWNSTFVTLGIVPPGFRPPADLPMNVVNNMAINLHGQLVAATGALQVRYLGGTVAQSTNNFVSFSGNSWVATQ